MAALQSCALITFSTVNAKNLYGTNDGFFFFWRYLAFSVLGIVGAAVSYYIPIERVNRFWTKSKKRIASGVIAFGAVIGWFIAITTDSVYLRQLQLWMNPNIDPSNSGWEFLHRHDILTAAQWFGGNDPIEASGYMNGRILQYILTRLGLAMFLFVFILMVMLLAFMAAKRLKMKKYNVPFNNFLATLIITFYTICFISNVARLFHWLPVYWMSLPFVSYDRVMLVVNLCLLGLFLRAVNPKEVIKI